MCDRALRSGHTKPPTGPTIMSSTPPKNIILHLAGTPKSDQNTTHKLTSPNPSHATQDFENEVPTTPTIMDLTSLHKSIADLNKTVTSRTLDLKEDIKKAGIVHSKEMDKLESRILASQEKK